MKIDILGRGRMPRTGLLLPAYDVEVTSLEELKKYAYLKFLKVYVHGTNLQITANNYIELFKVTNAAPVVNTTPVIKKEKKEKKVETPAPAPTPAPTPVVEKAPVVEEPAPAVEAVEELPSKTLEEVEETTVEAVEEAVEESVEESVEDTNFSKKNKKRNR